MPEAASSTAGLMHRNPRNVLIKTGGHANTVSATNAGVNPVPKNGITITRIAKLGITRKELTTFITDVWTFEFFAHNIPKGTQSSILKSKANALNLI